MCIETFLISWATSPGWWVRGNGGSVWVCVEEQHDTVHCITWEIQELGQRVENILFFCGGRGTRGQRSRRGHSTGWIDCGEKRRVRWNRWLQGEEVQYVEGSGIVNDGMMGDEGVTERGYRGGVRVRGGIMSRVVHGFGQTRGFCCAGPAGMGPVSDLPTRTNTVPVTGYPQVSATCSHA